MLKMELIKEDIQKLTKNLSSDSDFILLLNELNKDLFSKEPTPLFTKKQIGFFLAQLKKDTSKEVTSEKALYYEFKILKKSGDYRLVHAPIDSLKNLLKCIDLLIRNLHTPHFRAFGFIQNKSIVDNAKIHIGKNYVYNIDLKDFFHSFDINQVKWAFYNHILSLVQDKSVREKMAYDLASLVTYTVNGKRTLPQGSPSSPSITNMICMQLDKKLYRLARKSGAEYSRYADDISFSANKNIFKGEFIHELHEIIKIEGLEINPKKTRLQRSNQKQEVTGLTVNQDVNVSRKYIKELRHLLYLCETYGLDKAQTILQNNKNQHNDSDEDIKLPNIELFLKGKLNYLSMVKSKDHSTYLKLEERFNQLFPKKTTLVKQVINVWNEEGMIKAYETFHRLKKVSFKNVDFLTGSYDSEIILSMQSNKLFSVVPFLNHDDQQVYRDALKESLRKGLYFLTTAQDNPKFEMLIKIARDLKDSDEKLDEFFELVLRSNNQYSSEEWLDYYLLWRKNSSSLKMMLLSSNFETITFDLYQIFISDLLNHPTISKTERVAVIELWDIEIQKKLKRIEEKITTLRGNSIKPEGVLKASDNKNLLSHDPSAVTNFLNKFKDNTALKWTTHLWDNLKYNSIESFINEINEDKSYLSLFNHNRDLLNLIKYFIYTPTTPIENNIPQYGWSSKLSEMKFGWQFPNNLLIDWCKINYDNKDINSRKSPFKFIIPRELRPKNKVKGFEVKYFEDVVNVFKTEIQFRDNYLENEILKLQNRMKDFEFSGLESLRNLDFYTYTSAVLASIETILLMIRKYETANLVQFKSKIDAQYLNLTITQPNSFPSKLLNLENTKLFIGGELNAIAANLFSLADFSISTKFTTIDNQLIDGELKILHQESIAEWVNSSTINLVSNPIFEKNQSESTGFTYNITFKL
jgi:RNA-directed DNA polymerase